MKYRVVGWTYYENYEIECGEITWAARAAVVDDIAENGYLFSGWDHQESSNAVPVLNDGKRRLFTQRGFGGVMAEAHGYTGPYDYSLFAFGIQPDRVKKPRKVFDIEEFTPETDLNESFTVEVNDAEYAAANADLKLKIADLPELRYIDKGDGLTLKCGNECAGFSVIDVDRKKDMPEDELNYMMTVMGLESEEERKRMEKLIKDTPTALYIALKRI